MKRNDMQLSFSVEKKKEVIIQYIGVEQLLKEFEIYLEVVNNENNGNK